jgi:addiction module RelE/StbE family toxin
MKNISTGSRRVEFSDRFERQLQDAPDEIKAVFADTLIFFALDPNHPGLRNHALTGKLAGYRSINVTEDWRAVFREEQAGERNVIKFYQIGTHKDLYE